MNAFYLLVQQMPPPFNMITLITAIVMAASVVKALVKQVRVYADHEADRRLKREMIDNGLSVSEAERIASLEVTRHYEPAVK